MTEAQEPKQRGQMTIQHGHWWALVDKTGDLNTWAPIGKVSDCGVENALKRYRISKWYWEAGILDKITGPIIQSNHQRVVNVIRGTHAGRLPEVEVETPLLPPAPQNT